MFEAAAEAGSVLESPSPQVRIQQYAERGIEYELHVHTSNPIRQPQARHEVTGRWTTRSPGRTSNRPTPDGTCGFGENRPETASNDDLRMRSDRPRPHQSYSTVFPDIAG
jgi:hypothetical protein